MAKLLVKLPEGWDNFVQMDTKDYATLVEILARSKTLERKYTSGGGEHYAVKEFPLRAEVNSEIEIVEEVKG